MEENKKRAIGDVMSKYILPEGVEIKEIKQTMYSNGKFAYPDRGSAEYATAIGVVCECGKEFEGKHYTHCPSCREKHSDERYQKLELIKWDGETPLVIWDSDTYFFNEDDIHAHCEEEAVEIQDLQLVVCEVINPPSFDLDDFLEDILPEEANVEDLNDGVYTAGEVEAIVNSWLESVLSTSWSAGNKRVTLEV